MAVDGELGLALAELALDLDVVEAMGEVEALDLGALGFGGAVGDEGEADAGVAQRVDRGMGVGIEPVFGAAQFGEGVGDAVGQLVVGAAELGEAAADREAPRAGNVQPPLGGLGAVVPEGAGLFHHGHAHAGDGGRVMRVEVGREDMQQPRPRLLGLGVGADQRVVEIEQDGLRKAAT